MRDYGNTNAAPYASAPAVGLAGDTYWNTTSKTLYVSDGTLWLAAGAPSGAAGGDLSGTYPNPTVTAVAKSKWTSAGGTLSPANGTDTSILMGASTIKSAFTAGADGIVMNTNNPWGPNDAAKASWYIDINDTADVINVWRRAPGAAAGTITSPFAINGSNGRTSANLTDSSIYKSHVAIGHGIRTMNWVTIGSPSMPVNTWNLVASLTMTTSGGWVLFWVDLPLSYAMASTVSTFYTTIWRDGAPGGGTIVNGSTNRYTLCSSGFVYVPVPALCGIDNATAGAHTWYVYVYPGNCACQWGQDAANYRGIFAVMELL